MRRLVLLALAGCGFHASPGKALDASTGDSAIDASDPDAPPSDAPTDSTITPDGPPTISCYGSNFGRICLASAPTSTMTLAGTINTDTSAMCAATVQGTTISNACAIAADSLTITGRLVASGAKALVLVGASSITITASGSVDVSSHVLGVAGPVRGAGAALTCAGVNPASGNGGGAG